MAQTQEKSASSKRVLICEVEGHITRLLQRNLERQGYLVESSPDALHALELLANQRFDLVLLNSEMRDADKVSGWLAEHDLEQTIKLITRNGASFHR